MALQLRRGTNSQRLAITPANGELIFVTDYASSSVGPLWVGDGTTVGGVSVDINTTYTQNISAVSGGANLNLVGSDSTTDTVKFANGTGVTVAFTDASTATITNTGVTSAVAGTGVTVSSATGAVTFSIGQAVATTSNVTFAGITIDSRAVLDTVTLTTSATTANQVLDSFAAATYRTAKYIISVTSGSAYECVELLVIHDGTTASQTTYAELRTGADLATFTVDISGGNVRLLTTPANAVTVYKVMKTAIVV